MVELAAKREAAEIIQAQWKEVSQRRAAQLMNIPAEYASLPAQRARGSNTEDG